MCGGENVTGPPTCDCRALENGTWNLITQPPDCRTLSTATTISHNGQEILLVTGGETSSNAINYTTLPTIISYNGSTWESDIFTELNRPIFSHCVVKINSSTIFLIGGSNAPAFWKNATSETFFYDPSLNFWKPGPTLLIKRCLHACGILNWFNSTANQIQRVIVVAGGLDRANNRQTSVELLFLREFEVNNIGWRVGPPLPLKILASKMVELQYSLVLVGGFGQVDGRKLIKLTSPIGPWTMMNQTLKEPRDFHVAFLIPDALTNCG